MGIIIDVVLIVLLLYFCIRGAKRGAIRTVLYFASFIVAGLAVSLLATPLAEGIYHSFVKDNLTQQINSALIGTGSQAIGAQMEILFQKLPAIISNSVLSSGMTAASLAGLVSGATTLNLADSIAKLMAPAVIGMIRMIVSVLLFSVLLFVLRLVVRFIVATFKPLTKLPGIRYIDSILGFAFGLLSGLLIITVLCVLLQLIAFLPQTGTATLVQQSLESSFMFRLFYLDNPVVLAIKGMFA